MVHPEGNCPDCGITHFAWSAHKEFADKQENCSHQTILLKCKDCKKELGEGIYKKPIRCENCKGDVVESSGVYLCLSGCGHVKGEVIENFI